MQLIRDKKRVTSKSGGIQLILPGCLLTVVLGKVVWGYSLLSPALLNAACFFEFLSCYRVGLRFVFWDVKKDSVSAFVMVVVLISSLKY